MRVSLSDTPFGGMCLLPVYLDTQSCLELLVTKSTPVPESGNVGLELRQLVHCHFKKMCMLSKKGSLNLQISWRLWRVQFFITSNVCKDL